MERDIDKKDNTHNNKDIAQQGHFIGMSFKIKGQSNTSSALIKKTNQLAAAVRVLSAYISQTESIRERLSFYADQLIDAAAHLSVLGRRSDIEVLMQYKTALSALVCLIDSGFVAGYISKINHSILETEIIKMTELCAEWEKLELMHDALHFDDVKIETFQSNVYAIPRETIAPAGTPLKEVPLKDNQSTLEINKKTKTESSVKSKETKDVYKGQIESPRKKNRRETILSVIKKKGTVSINDLVPIIKTCSEKTIQRELISLVSEGIVRKEGERRWSTYTIV